MAVFNLDGNSSDNQLNEDVHPVAANTDTQVLVYNASSGAVDIVLGTENEGSVTTSFVAQSDDEKDHNSDKHRLITLSDSNRVLTLTGLQAYSGVLVTFRSNNTSGGIRNSTSSLSSTHGTGSLSGDVVYVLRV